MNTLSTHRATSASPLANKSPSPVSPVSNSNASPLNPKSLSNQQIEAVIQMATSSANTAARDTRTQLFVGNLPYRVRWQDVKDLFRKAGTVLRADVSLGPDNRSRGYGTVLLATSEDAARAVEMFNGYNWQTRTLEVRPDRIPPDFDNPSSLSVPAHQSPIPQILAKAFPIPVHPTYGSPLADRSLPYAGSDEFDSSTNLGERMRSGSSLSARSLFVGNLPFHCQWQDLKDLFRQAGSILRADVALGPDGRSRGFGTVSFTNDIDTEKAVNMFNGYEYNGRILKVHYDKYSQGPSQSPLPSSALATPSPTQLHHPHSGPPTHISMPIPPPVSAFEHFTTGHPPSPFDHPFGQLSPYDVYPTHMVGGAGSIAPPMYMTSTAIPSSVYAQQVQPGANTLVTSQDSVSSSPVAKREGETIQHPPHNAAPTVTSKFSATTDPSVSSAISDNTCNVGTTTSTSTQSETQLAQSTQQHHPHPGPISLPSPPLHGFPIGGPVSPLQGLPPLTPSMPSFTFVPQNATPPLNAHFLSPGVGITPFSPPMSPGSFYHPPANQRYHVWNVAPGAPLHVPSAMGSPSIYPEYSNPTESNNMDYFSVPPPPARVAEGYFPPVSVPSRLSKEIKEEGSSNGESPPEESGLVPELTSGKEGGRNRSDGSVPTVSETSSLEELGGGLLGSLAAKIGEDDLEDGLEEELAKLSIQAGLREDEELNQGRPFRLPVVPVTTTPDFVPAIPQVPQRTHSDGSKEDGGGNSNLKNAAMAMRDPWGPIISSGSVHAERRASWTPASELARADFKKGLLGEEL